MVAYRRRLCVHRRYGLLCFWGQRHRRPRGVRSHLWRRDGMEKPMDCWLGCGELRHRPRPRQCRRGHGLRFESVRGAPTVQGEVRTSDNGYGYGGWCGRRPQWTRLRNHLFGWTAYWDDGCYSATCRRKCLPSSSVIEEDSEWTCDLLRSWSQHTRELDFVVAIRTLNRSRVAQKLIEKG
jgi:hypothetical protein